MALRIYESQKPVIAAINGPAVGVGITMTLPMDIRLASSAAQASASCSRAAASCRRRARSWFLPRVVGISQAMEWVLHRPRLFGAEEALHAGLVSRVVPPEELLPAANALAREIADNTSAISVTASPGR